MKMNECKNLYNALANEYLEWQNKNINYSELTRNYIDFILKSNHQDNQENLDLQDEKSANKGLVLELGCSVGDVCFALAELGYRVIGVDFSEKMIAKANERLKLSKFKEQIKFLALDFSDSDFVDTISSIKEAWGAELSLVLSCLDTINHLSEMKLNKLFCNLDKVTTANTIFACDILSEAYFYEMLSQNYTEDLNGSYIIWENFLSEEPLENEVKLIKFEKVNCTNVINAEPLFSKCILTLKEYFYEPEFIQKIASEHSYELCELIYSVYDEYYDLPDNFEVKNYNGESNDSSFCQYFSQNLPMRFFMLFRKK